MAVDFSLLETDLAAAGSSFDTLAAGIDGMTTEELKQSYSSLDTALQGLGLNIADYQTGTVDLGVLLDSVEHAGSDLDYYLDQMTQNVTTKDADGNVTYNDNVSVSTLSYFTAQIEMAKSVLEMVSGAATAVAKLITKVANKIAS